MCRPASRRPTYSWQPPAAENVPPAACLVVEDSVPGAMAARAAGMACVGLARYGDDPALRAAGAVLIDSLAELPAILRAAMVTQFS